MSGDSSGSQYGGVPGQHVPQSTQAVFGEEDEDFQATQLNPGEQYAPVHDSFQYTSQESRYSDDGTYNVPDTPESQLYQVQSTPSGAGDGASPAVGSHMPPPGILPPQQGSESYVRDSQDIFGDNAPNTDATQIAGNAEEEDLFGDGDQAEGEEEDLFGDGDQGVKVEPQEAPDSGVKQEQQEQQEEQEIEEQLNDDFMNLFGDEELPQLAAEAEPRPAAEDDELDLFGEISDEEKEEFAEKVQIRKREQIKDPIALFKLPHVINFQKQAFDKTEALDELEHQWDERALSGGGTAIKLTNPENTYRWRFKTDENGKVVYGKDDLPIYESNTRIVEFDDGSKFLVLGDEYFKLTEKHEKHTRTHLFSEQEDNVFVHHKAINAQMGAIPLSIGSSTHNKLMNAQIRKVQPDRRIVQVTKHQVADRQQRYVQDQEADKKLKRIHGGPAKTGQKNILSADFLEGDEGGLSLKKIKKDSRHGDAFLQKTSKTLGGDN